MLNEKLQLVRSTRSMITSQCWLWGYLPDPCCDQALGVQAPANWSQCQWPKPCWPENSSTPARPCHLLLPLAREHWGWLAAGLAGWGKGASQMGPTGLFKIYSMPQKSYSKNQLLSPVVFCSCAVVHSTSLLLAARWCSRLAKRWHFYPGERYDL